MVLLNQILQNEPKTPQEKILNNSVMTMIVIPRTPVQSFMRKY